MEKIIEAKKEAVLTIKENGELIGVVYSGYERKKPRVFYKVTQMDDDDLLSLINKNV